jgi:hypothetical protein
VAAGRAAGLTPDAAFAAAYRGLRMGGFETSPSGELMAADLQNQLCSDLSNDINTVIPLQTYRPILRNSEQNSRRPLSRPAGLSYFITPF